MSWGPAKVIPGTAYVANSVRNMNFTGSFAGGPFTKLWCFVVYVSGQQLSVYFFPTQQDALDFTNLLGSAIHELTGPATFPTLGIPIVRVTTLVQVGTVDIYELPDVSDRRYFSIVPAIVQAASGFSRIWPVAAGVSRFRKVVIGS